MQASIERVLWRAAAGAAGVPGGAAAVVGAVGGVPSASAKPHRFEAVAALPAGASPDVHEPRVRPAVNLRVYSKERASFAGLAKIVRASGQGRRDVAR